MTLVVDASVAFKWFAADEELVPQAADLLASKEALFAPDILVAEVCNTAWRCVRQGRMEAAHADRIAAMLPAYFAALAGSAMLAPRAGELARELDHPVYDCLYLSLAEARQSRLVTADPRFLAKLAGTRWEGAALSLTEYGRRP